MKKSLCLLLVFMFVGMFSYVYAGKIPVRGYVNAKSGLHVRASASTSGTILKSIAQNTQVSILNAVGNWYKISAESVVGYVYASYITVTETGDDYAEDDSAVSEMSNNSGEPVNVSKATLTGRNLNKSAINAIITNVP